MHLEAVTKDSDIENQGGSSAGGGPTGGVAVAVPANIAGGAENGQAGKGGSAAAASGGGEASARSGRGGDNFQGLTQGDQETLARANAGSTDGRGGGGGGGRDGGGGGTGGGGGKVTSEVASGANQPISAANVRGVIGVLQTTGMNVNQVRTIGLNGSASFRR